MNKVEVVALPVGQLKANCYLVYDSEFLNTFIVDPGDDADFIYQKITDLNLTPQAIIATHAHFDHIMAVNELKINFKIPFYLPRGEEELLSWMRKSALYFTKTDPGPAPKVDKFIDENTALEIENCKLKIISTPGHTPGGVCLYLKASNILLSGDTIFARGGVGRYDFPYSNKTALKKSIEKLLKLPDDTKVFPGHGEPTTIGEFKKNFKELV